MSASIKKLTAREHAAYLAHVAAIAAVVTARLDAADPTDPVTEQRIGKLARRAQAYRSQWLALSRELELADERVNVQGAR